MVYFLYNALANNGHGAAVLPEAEARFPDMESTRVDYVGLDIGKFFDSLHPDDIVVLCGGDGTLNRFANDLGDRELPCDIYLWKAGTGNDFLRDVADKAQDGLCLINPYLKDLPTVTVKGKTTKYLNGIGYGIDGTACEVADQQRAAGKTDIDYTAISVKLLLGSYKCPSAKITVDGVTHVYKHVWLASAMKGRYYGGGMNAAPMQDRTSGKLTCAVWHDAPRLLTLMRFPKIFKGEHAKYRKMVDFFVGDEITVEFDRPNALQIDGETVLAVNSYTARTAKAEARRKAKEAAKA